MKPKIVNIFDWLNEITYRKSPSSSFSDEDWDKWNSYMVNRFISMNPDYLELVNYVQTTPYEQKEQLYNIYKEFIPKKKMFLKYIKPKKKMSQKDLLRHVTDYFECSVKEADEYITLLKKKDLHSLLTQRGLDEKEIKKLLKK